MCHNMSMEVRGELGEVGSFSTVGPVDRTQLVNLSSKSHYSLSYLASSPYFLRQGFSLNLELPKLASLTSLAGFVF